MQTPHLEVPRGQVEMALSDVNAGDICPGFGKLYEVGTEADADLQESFSTVCAEIDINLRIQGA